MAQSSFSLARVDGAVASDHGLEPEALDPLRVAEELVLDERLDVVLPDAPQSLLLLGRRLEP